MKQGMAGTKDHGVNGLWAWAGSKTGASTEKKHSAKWDRCVDDVKAKGKDVDPYAVCTAKVDPVYEEQADKKKAEMPAVDPNKLSSDERSTIELLNEDPMMSASVFYNKLKSKGFKIMAPEGHLPPDQKQADSATSQPAGILIGQKKTPQKQSEIKDKFLKVRFREGVAHDKLNGASKFRVVLLQEGMGNLKDGFFYTKDALKSAVPVFEGAKIYADHPDKMEEQIRPERSVRDVLGHFENVHYAENDDGQGELTGDVCVLDDDPYKWARSLMTHAVEYSNKYPDRDFIGLSINASGDANPIETQKLLEQDIPLPIKQKLSKALGEGVDTVRIVTAIKDAISCDLVTEAGAGGKVLELLEGDKKMKKEGEEKKKETKVDPQHGFEKKAEGDQADHADEQQDIELIKKMIAKHMGDDSQGGGDDHEKPPAAPADDQKQAHDDKDPDHDGDADMHHGMSAQEMEAAMHAYEYMSKHEGMQMPEAAKHAAMHVKCAKAYAAKQAEAMKHSEDEGMKHAESEGEEKKKEGKKKEDEGKKESEVARLAGRVAFLEAQIKKTELEKTIEKTLKESKLPMSATKAFKESVGEVKDVNEFNRLFKVFKEAYKASGEAGTTMLDLSIEKTSRYVESTDGGKADTVGFSDCLK